MDKTKFFYFEFNNQNKKLIIENKKLLKKNNCSKEFLIYYAGEPKIGDINFSNINIEFKSSFLKKINGEFLIIVYNKKKKIFFIINDRYTSIPLYYIYHNNILYFSNNYLYLYKKIKNKVQLTLKQDSFIEFLIFRKLHGNKTFDNKIKYLDYASKVEVSKKFKISKYWFPSFKKKSYENLNDCSSTFIKIITHALKIKLNKKKSINLFLSGGLDTRLILASLLNLKIKPKCFTFGFNKNSEFFYAKQLTKIYKLKHNFIKINKKEIINHLKYKFQISSGMYNHFINFFSKKKIKIIKQNDVTLHGHGLDYMFQGMYMPNHQFKIFNKSTHLKYFVNLKDQRDLIKYYFDNSTYKTRNFNVDQYCNNSYKKVIKQKIILNLKKDFKEIYKIKSNNDKWEYLLIKNLSRHYSHLDVISLSEYGLEKKIAYENELFNFYLSLENKYRFDGKMVKNSLKILNKKFANIPSANHGMNITFSSKFLFLRSIINKIIYFLTSNLKYKHPNNFRRTFPDLDIQIQKSKEVQNLVDIMFKSKSFKQFLQPLDFDKILKDYLLMLQNKKKNFGQIIFLLLHLYNLKKYFK